MNDKILKKQKLKSLKQVAIYSCTKFQLIWRTSDFGTKFAQKNMNDKNFEKINIKIEISI